jgi:hypothetical protein
LNGITASDVCCDPLKESIIIKGLSQSLGIEETAIALSESFCQGTQCNRAGRRSESSILLTFTAVTGTPTTLMDTLHSPDLLTSLTSMANVSVGSVSIKTLPVSSETEAGWTYGPLDPSGQYPLIKCNPGHLLINDSISSQNCIPCAVGKYSVDYLDGCRGLSSCSSGRSCNKCPLGARCNGKNDFTAENPTSSVWMPEYDVISRTTIMKLTSCPEGTQTFVKATIPCMT